MLDAVSAFDSFGLNVSVGGRHSSIVVPLDTNNTPNILFWYAAGVIAYTAGTPENAIDPNIGDVSP